MKRAKDILKGLPRTILVCVPMVLIGCAGGVDDELLGYVDEVKARPGGRIEPLPQIKPYEKFAYAGDEVRSPFEVARPEQQVASKGPTPNADRNKEYLEQFPLDTLEMVGTLDREGETFGLLQTQDGMVHRVIRGNYVGQNDGRIVVVSDVEIRLEELVPDGIGGFYKRSTEIGLGE